MPDGMGTMTASLWSRLNGTRFWRVVWPWVSGAGILVVLFNILAGMLLPLSPAIGQPLPVSVVPSFPSLRLIVCTVGGMVVLDENGAPVKDEKAATGGICAFCLSALHGGFGLPAAPIAIRLPRMVLLSAPLPPQTARPVRFRLTGAVSARAPPVPA